MVNVTKLSFGYSDITLDRKFRNQVAAGNDFDEGTNDIVFEQ